MLLAAPVLADCAPEDIQKRALARYTFLFADSALDWMRRWKNQLKQFRFAQSPIDTSNPYGIRLSAVFPPRLQ